MFAWVQALFSSTKNTKKPSDGTYYFGAGFEQDSGGRGKTELPKPDKNGKVYSRFRLIEEGPNKGRYESVLHFYATRSYSRDEIEEAELRDIRDSGFEIFAPDPKGSK